ncbi:hypothetical protein AX15_000527 [Amanita polypyramis BW_CC]|nr:hypothetical protein AX15_000527 [Amanita polypyramis BW_CC]
MERKSDTGGCSSLTTVANIGCRGRYATSRSTTTAGCSDSNSRIHYENNLAEGPRTSSPSLDKPLATTAGSELSQAQSQPEYFRDTIRRAEASLQRTDRATRCFHDAKRKVDQALRRIAPQHKEAILDESADGISFDSDVRTATVDTTKSGKERRHCRSPEASGLVAASNCPSDGDNTVSLHKCHPRIPVNEDVPHSARPAEQQASPRRQEDQHSPLIDAIESRAARMDQLVEEMERLLVDTQRVFHEMDHAQGSEESEECIHDCSLFPTG